MVVAISHRVVVFLSMEEPFKESWISFTIMDDFVLVSYLFFCGCKVTEWENFCGIKILLLGTLVTVVYFKEMSVSKCPITSEKSSLAQSEKWVPQASKTVMMIRKTYGGSPSDSSTVWVWDPDILLLDRKGLSERVLRNFNHDTTGRE